MNLIGEHSAFGFSQMIAEDSVFFRVKVIFSPDLVSRFNLISSISNLIKSIFSLCGLQLCPKVDSEGVAVGSGSAGRDGAAGISPSDFASVVARNGKLPLSSVLLCRVRYFTRGAVLGGQEFVHAHVLATSAGGSGSRKRRVIPLPQITDWGDLATLVAVRL